MFKNESMILKEWLDHNIDVGVEHFYLIDNGSTDGYFRVLRPYMRKGYISLVRDPSRWKYGGESRKQLAPYFDPRRKGLLVGKGRCDSTHAILMNRHFLQLVKNNATWLMVIDPDEYIFSPRGKISDVLTSVPEVCRDIWIPWRVFGSGGHTTQPESIRKGFVHMQHFCKTRGMYTNRGKGKSISRVSAIQYMDVHECCIYNRHTMTPDGRLHGDLPPGELSSWIKTYAPNKNRDIFFCNHYILMSREYFTKYKSRRGGGAHEVRAWSDYWRNWDEGSSRVDTLILTATGLVCDDAGTKNIIREAVERKKSEKSL